MKIIQKLKRREQALRDALDARKEGDALDARKEGAVSWRHVRLALDRYVESVDVATATKIAAEVAAEVRNSIQELKESDHYIAKIERLDPQPGDVIAVTVDGNAPMDAVLVIASGLTQIFPATQIVMFSSGTVVAIHDAEDTVEIEKQVDAFRASLDETDLCQCAVCLARRAADGSRRSNS